MNATVSWKEGLVVEGTTASGHHVVMQAPQEDGGETAGPRPIELVLLSLGGCTTMDVVSILRKMRQPFQAVEVRIDGRQREEHPRSFTSIHLEYVVRGDGLDPALVEKAVSLSQDRYCPVSATLRPGVALSYSVRIEQSATQRR